MAVLNLATSNQVGGSNVLILLLSDWIPTVNYTCIKQNVYFLFSSHCTQSYNDEK